MKSFLLCLLLATCVSVLPAQQPTYSRVKIFTGDRGMQKLTSLGIETDHGDYRKNVWFISDFSSNEIEKIKAAGFRYEIMVDDVISYYRNQVSSSRLQAAATCANVAPVYAVPSNFSLGSMGGYFTYEEMMDQLDSMASKYPSLITTKQAIPGNTTIEGDSIYFVKISDNVLTDETEPEVLYTAVHHAREPGGMSQLIFYMWYLLENYGTNPETDAIINNTELFFITCVNPDGYKFNQLMEPNGGGMWRKNRRDNLNGSFGVDLNRNYGYNWGYDDTGSSPDEFDETYRGTSAFSEPETDLVKDFTASRNFVIALNYHTFGNLLIYPWGYDFSIYTPDSALYENYGNLLTTYNGYTYGTGDQTVGYITNGTSDDWMYGEQVLKPKIFAMTPEAGDAQFGFWPPSGEIIPLCQSNMFQNISTALLAGKYAKLTEITPELVANGGGYIKFNIRQLGLDTTGSYTVSLAALSSNIVSTGNSVSHGNLNVLEDVVDSISFALTSPMTNGEEIKFLLSIDNGLYVRSDTIIKYFGSPTIAYATSANATAGWNAGQWGISTTTYYSATGSITDSPNGDYDSNEFSICRLTTPVDLTTAVKATLSFYARWALEPNFDYVQVQASSNGVTWEPLCGYFTVPGSAFQEEGEPLYEGFQLSWVKEEISLDDYLGDDVLVRFVLSSDNFQEHDGFYFDDLAIETVLPGTNSISETNGIAISSLMPNPAGDYTYVNHNGNGDVIIFLYDALGKQVQSIRSDVKGSVKIETGNLAPGVYFVRIQSGNSLSNPLKLVKN